MNDEEMIKEMYHNMYQGMIEKDRRLLESVLAPEFVLVHMTGMHQSREVYISSIENGTLNYYSERPVKITVTLSDDLAKLNGQSMVNAAVFGGGRHTWRLRQEIELKKTSDGWRMIKSVASTF